MVPDDRPDGRADAVPALRPADAGGGAVPRRQEPRNGSALRNTRIQHADRFDRFLLILALAYLLLAGLGLQAKFDFEPSQWCTNTRNSECSVFTIGKAMLGAANYDPDELCGVVTPPRHGEQGGGSFRCRTRTCDDVRQTKDWTWRRQ